jgi:TolB-like protein/Tfp pilus assembly protein PilF
MTTSTNAGGRLRCGAFELDVRSRELRRGDRLIRLQEQPFEILRMMLEHPGEVVTRDELRRRLWPDGTFVDFEHSLNAAVKRLRAALGDEADNPRFVETLPRRGYRFIGHGAAPDEGAGAASGGAHPQIRLAVLPFTTLSDNAGQEYFTDGLTEETIAQLGQLCRGRLGVVARWSSMVFKGTTERAREIGRALRADYLLEGSVRREGDRARVTVRLIEAAAETQLWVETYERHLTDCLSVQAEVAARVAASLAVELAPDAAAPEGSSSVSAYQEYLRGRYFWNLWLRPEDEFGEQALKCFTDALRIDPRFAPAHAGAARVHIARASTYRERPRTALEAARAAAKRALELDDRVSQAHLAMGEVRWMLEWDWKNAEAEYLRAIALNPSEESTHRRYGLMLGALVRLDEAILETERACELDPLCLVVKTSAAFARYLAGDARGALDWCRRITDVDPEYRAARELVGIAYLQMGKTHDAIAVLEAALAAGPQDRAMAASLAYAHAVAGDRAAAETLAAELERPDAARYTSPFLLALVRLGLGDLDGAFAALERAVADADPALPYVAVEPRFEPIRADARYGRLLELLCLT